MSSDESMNPDRGAPTGRKLLSWIGVVLGVLAFFLPLIGIHAPMVGDMQWSSYNIVSGIFGSSSGGDSPSFSKVLSNPREQPVSASSESPPEREIPFGMRAAMLFPVTVLCSYVALIGVVLLLLFSYSPRAVAFVSALGLLMASYSLVAVFLLDDALKSQMTQSMKGMESNPFAALGAALVASIHVQPGAGVYLLVACFAFTLLLQYIAGLDRLTLRLQ